MGSYSDISFQDLLILTNQRRAENKTTPLKLDSLLANAANLKAADMFSKNYWAHNSPDGITPWYFIRKAGYDYVYAGENLARGFSSSRDVIAAWMASREHRENMLSANFEDVGFTVEEGRLNGEDTVLVVEMLGGKKIIATGGVPKTLSSQTIEEEKNIPTTSQFDLRKSFNSEAISANFVKIILGIFIATFLLDLIVIERRKIVRFTGHNLDHILFLTIILICLMALTRGLTL